MSTLTVTPTPDTDPDTRPDTSPVTLEHPVMHGVLRTVRHCGAAVSDTAGDHAMHYQGSCVAGLLPELHP